MAMDVPTNRETEEPDEDDDSTGALGFASTESAQSALEPTILDRIPRLHILYLGACAGSLATGLLLLLIVTLA